MKFSTSRIPFAASVLTASILTLVSCDVLNQATKTAEDMTSNLPGGGGSTQQALTNDEVIQGLKEALKVGIENGSAKASAVDGFFKNTEIKIPFPPDAEKVREKAEKIGMQSQVDKVVETVNRAAEEAAKTAAPIFIDAIRQMTVQDGFAILKGADNAATTYLKDKTTQPLHDAFKPVVQDAIKKVKLTDLWNPIITKYNQVGKFSGWDEINPDLDEYVTQKAMAGLFHLMEKEEAKIRKDPVARVNDILKKVFGSLDK